MRVSSSAGLLAYDRPWPAPNPIGSDKPAGGARPRSTVVVVVSARAEQQINLKCDLANLRRPFEFGHKVLWYSNGAFLHSSSTTDVYNFSLAARDQAAHAQASRLLDGPISCAHHLLESSAIINSPANFHANSMRVYPSANDIDLRLQGELATGAASRRPRRRLVVTQRHMTAPVSVSVPFFHANLSSELTRELLIRVRHVSAAHSPPLILPTSAPGAPTQSWPEDFSQTRPHAPSAQLQRARAGRPVGQQAQADLSGPVRASLLGRLVRQRAFNDGLVGEPAR